MSFLRTLLPLALIACTSPLGSEAAAAPRPSERSPAPEARRITFNQRPATAQDLATLARFEAVWGIQVPAGDYWYDNVSGAAGLWGGPTRGFLGAGLRLGGEVLPTNASGGGRGNLTNVFINGRELHPLDVQGLTALFGHPPWPGQWWVDGQGYFGAVGQGPLGNLVALAQQRNQRGGGGNSRYSSDINTGRQTFVGSGCTAVSQRLRPSDTDSSYSYYVGCE